MPSTLINVCSLVLCAAGLAVAGVSHDAAFDWNDVKYVYAFGDSYTFVQGTEGLANFSFFGDSFNFSFTPQQVLDNQIIFKNTSSDGANWIEFVTGCFAGHPSSCAPRQLWDFAYAGADIDGNLLPRHEITAIPLVNQVQQYIEFVKDVVPHPKRETLTAWWIGINDTGDTVTNATITNFTAFWNTEMNSYFNAVQAAVDNGLNGAQLFFNVPPMQRAPLWLTSANHSVIQDHVEQYNEILAQNVARFAKANPDLTVLSFDAHSWFNSILDNHAAYGFKNITGFCECTDDTFFWYNVAHPVQRVHELLAKALESKLQAASIGQ